MNIYETVLNLLLPVAVSGLLAFFIARYTIRKQIATLNLPNLIKFYNILRDLSSMKAGDVTKSFENISIKNQVDTKPLINLIMGRLENCREVCEEYPKYRPFITKKYRREIDKLISSWQDRMEQMTNAILYTSISKYAKDHPDLQKKVNNIFEKRTDEKPSCQDTVEMIDKTLGENPMHTIIELAKLAIDTMHGIKKLVEKNIDDLN